MASAGNPDPSPTAESPAVLLLKQCGGCHLQHLSYAAQLAYKTKEVQDDLERIGGITDVTVRPAIGMDAPWRYRNKAQFPVGQGKDGCAIGFTPNAATALWIPSSVFAE